MPASAALRILLIGNGGREHALAWKLEQSPTVEHVYVAPGNGGTELGSKVSNVSIAVTDFEQLLSFAVENKINLVIPGPEKPLVEGVEAVFRKRGIPVFGPSPEAAQMEGSKAFSKAFMTRHNIPTAAYQTFTDFNAATAYVHSVTHEVVIKADGLADGKGVLLPMSKGEALDGLEDMMVRRGFGKAGDQVVIEEFLAGQELSVLAFCDGYTIKPLPLAQDHKQIYEGDTGPNTGGMGTYSPSPLEDATLNQKIMDQILKPSLDGMRKDGIPFVGLLFVGLMISPSGQPKVVEYNVRFGDPEVQSLMSLLSPKTDLAQVMLACTERRLDFMPIEVQKDNAVVTVVLASGGYPGSYAKGKEITIQTLPPNVNVFHAGTAVKDGKLVTAGGRVLAVTAVAENLQAAVDLAYKGVACVSFEGMQFRKDIAHKALNYKKAGMTYSSAGVDIEAGNALVERIKTVVKSTKRPGADADIGGFGGLFDLKATSYKDPILVSGTDGVGTKLKIAQEVGKHDTIGVDLVAMCVNDLVVQGAEPLFFLDYFACSKLDLAVTAAVVEGIAEGCRQAGSALVGGETAEMPGLYQEGDYDLAGFSVGAVERTEVLPLTSSIKAGDVLIGVGSSGIHSNGYSLVRKIVEASPLGYKSPAPWNSSTTLGQELLTPTQIYMKQLLPVLRDPALQGAVKALSNITGGGWIENIPRVLPAHLSASIDASRFTLPPLFDWLMKAGNVDPYEMTRVFNCGVGMVLVVEASRVSDVMSALQKAGSCQLYSSFGVLEEGDGQTKVSGLESWK